MHEACAAACFRHEMGLPLDEEASSRSRDEDAEQPSASTCERWARQGECANNREYMLRACAEACAAAAPAGAAAPSGASAPRSARAGGGAASAVEEESASTRDEEEASEAALGADIDADGDDDVELAQEL